MLEDQNYIGNLAVSALRGRNYQNNNIKQNNIAKNNIATATKQKIYTPVIFTVKPRYEFLK